MQTILAHKHENHRSGKGESQAIMDHLEDGDFDDDDDDVRPSNAPIAFR